MGVGEGVGNGSGDGLVEGTVNLVERDANNINDHLKVAFEDVLAEPDGAHSNDCVWNCSYNCFNGCKVLCYRILTLLCGWLYACCWGCQFACVTFQHVWQFTPCLRMFSINCGCLQKVWGTTVQCCCAPIFEVCGLCFSKISVTNSQG